VLDENANADHEERIESVHSRLPIWVLPTDEERVIARHTSALVEHGDQAAV
jgi:acetate kinase